MSEDRATELERRLALVEQARRELGDQVAHLVELLEKSRREIAWLKSEIEKRDAASRR